jgi:SAM-dependent methyltransferase
MEGEIKDAVLKMMDKEVVCRVCGRGKILSMGKIPDCSSFAGQSMSPPIKGGLLWKCMECGSMFRYPVLSEKEYLALYEAASSTVWAGETLQRNDFSKIYSYLAGRAGGAILEVGCYAGKFLDGLPDKFVKYGLEPSAMASRNSAAKGITMLGKTLDDLAFEAIFDVIVAIDVIEHVLDVNAFLTSALRHVGKNGVLIISTGDPDCFFWNRIFKARFWYCSFPEHLIFPSFKYYCAYSRLHGLPQPEQMRFKYADIKFSVSLYKLLHQLLFAISPFVYRIMVRWRIRYRGGKVPLATDISPGVAGVFVDHQMVVFRK